MARLMFRFDFVGLVQRLCVSFRLRRGEKQAQTCAQENVCRQVEEYLCGASAVSLLVGPGRLRV